MPKIELTNVTKRWGKFYAVENLDLCIEDNSFVTLLGPSGCGKTTTLRMIAGLETPTSGRITIGDTVVFDSEAGINVPANKRKVGFLFQNYALWPNMTVYKNIAFGLENIKEELPQIDFAARNAARSIEIMANPEELVRLIEECKDKKGAIDKKKVCLKLIDSYTICEAAAKQLFAYGLHKENDLRAAAEKIAAEQQKKLDSLRREHEAKGVALNEDFALTKDGKVLTSLRKLCNEEIDLAVRRVSRIVKIGMFMDRYPAELSGGQQQRVAIARTLAPEPSVLFMDEPLSNLDAKLRLEMRYELQRLHVETGSTFVYVTHDQMEAMTLATKICLINNGVLQQYDAPLTVYNRPENLFVADFVGNPSINFIEARGKQLADGSIKLSLLNGCEGSFRPAAPLDLAAWRKEHNEKTAQAAEEGRRRLSDKNYVEKANRDEKFNYHIARVNEEDFSIREEPELTDEDFVLGVRPEFVSIGEDGAIEGEIYGAMPTGMESTMKIRVGEYLLTGVVFGSSAYKIGAKTRLGFDGNTIMLFDRQSGRCVATGSLELK